MTAHCKHKVINKKWKA